MPGLPKAWAWLRVGILLAAVAGLSFIAWDSTEKLLKFQPLGIDFLPMWAAAHEAFIHPKTVYDFVALTHFEHPLLAHFRGLRPFVYPPTALLAFAPLGLVSFAAANALWTVAGLVILLATMATRVKSPRVLVLLAMALSPASVLVMVTGQVTFVIAAAVVVGLLNLKTRPVLAGVLFGLAAVIKPQSLVLLPVALIAIGQWRAIAAVAVTGLTAAVAATAVFGVHVWFEWLAAMPRFEHFVMGAPGLRRGMITPTALGIFMGLDPGGLATWRLLFAIGGGVMNWFVFRRTEDPARRLTALLGGSLFVTPYAMHYDAALLAPAAALMLTHRQRLGGWSFALLASALLCCAAIPHWGAAAVTGFVLLVALTPESAFDRWFSRLPRLGPPARQEAAA